MPAPFDASPPRFVKPLLDALAAPAACSSHDDATWDIVIPLARSARLLGVLAHRVMGVVDQATLPARARRHLHAAMLEARFRRAKTLHLLHTIAPLLAAHPGPRVLLKGAAYIAQDLPLAAGRLPADVDLMVPRTSLDAIEHTLLQAGWEYEKTDPYDQHYYRAWSHELPPLQAAGQVMELDLHHAILPPLGRIRPDTDSLFASAVPLPDSPFHVLAPIDQVLHAVVHLTHDSDFVGRLRDLVDIDSLLGRLPLTEGPQAAALVERARHHGMLRPLWLAARLCQRWLDTPGCDALLRSIAAVAPGAARGAWVLPLADRVLGPPTLDTTDTRSRRAAGLVLEARAAWLRMPPGLLAYHAASKLVRRLLRRSPDAAPPQQAR